jgi:hypothetical protein
MDYLSILPDDIRCEIYSYLTPQEILYSCCLNKSFVKFLTEEFWCLHVTRTYNPQDFGIAKFDPNILTYLNIDSWTELAKLSFASRKIPAVVYVYNTRNTINMTFELNFFSSWKDMKNDLINYFDITPHKHVAILIKSHIDEDTEAGIIATGAMGNISTQFGILGWKFHPKVPSKTLVVAQNMEFSDNVHIGMFGIMNINFFLKIEKIELSLTLADDFVVPDDEKIKFSSTRQATLLSQINTHLLPEEKQEVYLASLSKYIACYLGW